MRPAFFTKENRHIRRKIQQNILPLLYPSRCPVCGKLIMEERQLVHTGCRRKLIYINGPCCLRCGRPLSHEGNFCTACAEDQKYGSSRFWFDRHVSVWAYSDLMRRSLAQFKYHNKREYAQFYAEEAIRLYGALLLTWQIEAVIPIPLHKSKYRQRGYNQAECFARSVAEIPGLLHDAGLLKRVKKTAPQKSLDAGNRFQNLAEAFSAGNQLCPYKTILLTDDIYTTGSTLNAAASILKKAGAEKVYCLTIATGMQACQ